MAHAPIPKPPDVHLTRPRESFIRPSTGERRAFERLIINMLPEWDDPQPLRLPNPPRRLPRLAWLGLSIAALGATVIALLRRRQ